MKTLIVYYSRTDTTKKVAERLAEKLGADLEAVIDRKKWGGIFVYFFGGRAAMREQPTDIGDNKYDPANYDLVVIGTPVWAGRVTPAIRTYLGKQAGRIKRAAFFTTQGGAKRQRVFDDLKDLVGAEPVTELWLRTRTVTKGDPTPDLDAFCKKIGAWK
jgi:flavodoxin